MKIATESTTELYTTALAFNLIINFIPSTTPHFNIPFIYHSKNKTVTHTPNFLKRSLNEHLKQRQQKKKSRNTEEILFI